MVAVRVVAIMLCCWATVLPVEAEGAADDDGEGRLLRCGDDMTVAGGAPGRCNCAVVVVNDRPLRDGELL